MNKALWSGSCFLVVCGLLFLIAGLILQLYQSYREPLKGKTTARVVELSLEAAAGRNSLKNYTNVYYPVFEYYAEGRLYKVKHPYGSYPSCFEKNQELKIVYDKDDPGHYQLAQTGICTIAAQGLYAAGVLLLFTGCVIFLLFARRG